MRPLSGRRQSAFLFVDLAITKIENGPPSRPGHVDIRRNRVRQIVFERREHRLLVPHRLPPHVNPISSAKMSSRFAASRKPRDTSDVTNLVFSLEPPKMFSRRCHHRAVRVSGHKHRVNLVSAGIGCALCGLSVFFGHVTHITVGIVAQDRRLKHLGGAG